MVEGALQHNAQLMGICAGILAGVVFLNICATVVGTTARLNVIRAVGHSYDASIARGLAAVPYVDQLAEPQLAAATQLLTQRAGLLAQIANGWLSALRIIMQFIGVAVSAVLIWPWLVVIPLGAIPALLIENRLDAVDEQAETASASKEERRDLLYETVETPLARNESTLWHAGAYLRDRFAKTLRGWRAPYDRAAGTRYRAMALPTLIVPLVTAVVIIFLTLRITTGAAMASALAGAFLVTLQLKDVTWAVPQLLRGLLGSTRAVRRALWVEEQCAHYAATSTTEGRHANAGSVAETARENTTEAPACREQTKVAGQGHAEVAGQPPVSAAPSQACAVALRCEGLTYRYPGTEENALHDVNIEIPAGSTVALVGRNGSGKTTFLDLALGLRQPSAGVCEWEGEATGVAATLQDFLRYEATVLENVAFSRERVAKLANRAKAPNLVQEPKAGQDANLTREADPVRAALEEVQLGGVLADLPEGEDTVLGTRWQGAHDLSGGQWQRLAVARARFQLRYAQAGRIAYDEASSALDAFAEEQLAKVFLDKTGHANVTFYVTHRMSIAKNADLILVWHNGKILESGTHAGLMAQGGLYREMFEAQATGLHEA